MRLYTPKKAKLIPPEASCVFKGILYDTYQWQQEQFDGTKTTYEMLKRPDTVRVITVVDNKIVIVKQSQPHVGYFIDIPGGMADAEDKNELEAMKRELEEETGIRCKTWKLLSAVQAHNKIENFNYLFLASDAEPAGAENTENARVQKLDASEKIEVVYMTLEEVKALHGNSDVRYLPFEILNSVNSIEELLALPSLVQL